MPRLNKKTTIRSSELKRAAILEAALKLFVARGFHGTAVPTIAELAQVGAGTIYRYFENKEALVNELYRHHKAQVAQHIVDGFPFNAPAREQFHAFWTKLTSYAQANRDAYAFLELHSHADYLDEESKKVERQVIELGLNFLAKTQEKGEVKSLSPMVLIAIVHGAFVSLMKMSWEGKIDLTQDELDAAEQCCWEAIRA